jgi:hypothetical protein
MFSKIKAYLPFYLLTAILLPTLIVLADIASNSFTPLEPYLDSPFTPENSPKSMKEFWDLGMAGPENCLFGYESPFIPFKYYAERGTRSFFIRGEKYFPIDPSKCSDLVLDRMGMAECLKRHGIKPEDLPPINPPPNRVPPLPPDAERLFFSIRGEGRFKAPPRISPEGKVGHPASEPPWWRAIALRLSPDFLQALEASLSGYLSNQINTEANKICNPAGGASYRYRRNANNTCTDLQNCASAGSGSGVCGSLVSCPGSTCAPSTYPCIDIPAVGDCAAKDTFPCDTNGPCARVAGDNNCIYIQTPLQLQLADCSNVNSINCPYTSSCADDGLAVDVNIPRFDLELFMRVVNYIPKPVHCNSPIIEHRCENCGSDTDCCDDAEICGLLGACPWLSAVDGCPCCDDYIRDHFWMDNIWAYNIAFLFYGPNSAPFSTPCGSPPTQFHRGHPGEWIDLCACNQDVSFGNYDSTYCDWGICGALADLIENFQRDTVRCTVSRQLNSLLSGALKSFLADVFPLSAMQLIGACNTNAYHIGFYPEICAGRSLGYIWDYWNGGAGLVLFADMTWQLGTASSCVAGGPCPMYPTSVPSTPCKSDPRICLPDSRISGNPTYDIGIYVDQQLINELFYVFWSQGLLCYTFTLSPDQAWMLIPGLRQVVGSPTAVEVSFIPVCNPTPQFSTSGGTFTLTIPRFYLRFRTAGGTQLFDIQMRMTISGQLGYVIQCHPLDTLCGSQFRCKRCYSSGCVDQYVQYGPGYLQITNVTIDPVVEDIVNRHSQINASPPYTEIADVIAVLLDGLINNALIRTRIYNLLGLLPLKMDLPGFFIGFQNNALVARLTLPRPLCINFLLEFGQFSPQIGLASSEFSEIPPDFQIAPKPKVETIVVPEENGRISPESINYQEEKREYVINSDEPIRFKVKSKIDNFYPDENSSVELLWRYEGGYLWHKIENGEFYFKPVSETTVEIFTAVRHLPSGVYTIVDENPVKIKVKKGIQGKIEGPDKLRPGELGVFEVKADYENLEISYGVDDGDFTRFLPTRTIKLRFEEGGKHTLKVILKSGEKYGVVSKEIEVEGEPAKGCGGPGLPFGLSLTGIFAIFFLTIGKRKKVKNGKK